MFQVLTNAIGECYLADKTTFNKNKEVRVMEFNATFNNIPVISWRSVLLVEETGEYPEKTTDLPQVTEKHYQIMLYSVTSL